MQIIVNTHTVFYAYYCLRLSNLFLTKVCGEFYSKIKDSIEIPVCHVKIQILTYSLISPFQEYREPIASVESPLNLSKREANVGIKFHIKIQYLAKDSITFCCYSR